MQLSLPRLILALLILVLPVAAQQNFKIAKIEFEGLNRLSADEVLGNTGLKIGETFSLASLDAAAQRLVDTGFFKNVGYKTRPNKDQITIIFQLEEAKVASSRVVFDNFIWFTDEELIGAVKRELPAFDGTAPDTGNTVDRIIKALQRFLHEQKIEATVTHNPFQEDPNSPVQQHVFTVNGVPLPICTLNFPGAQNITEAKLRESSQELRNSEYSFTFVRSFANRTLIQLYREVGQLKAAFSPPLAKPEATAKCKSGVEITIPVDEGHIYKWNKAEWTGNTGFTAQELDLLLGMQAGQPANGRKLDQSLRSIEKTHGRKGFLMAKVKSVPEFDEQALSVVYKMAVVEGPQFRMGRLSTRGFSESETNQINARWELKAGDIYDDRYSGEFLKKHVGEILRDNVQQRAAQGKPAPRITTEYKPDRKTLTVDVTIIMTDYSP